MKLVILITAKLELGLEVAQGWRAVGAPGATIIRTHGIHSLQREVEKGDIELPRMIASVAGAMAHIIDKVEERGELILTVVDDHLVPALEAEANKVLGDLTAPDTGVMFILPLDRAIGVVDHRPTKS